MKTLIDFIDRHHMLPDSGGLILCAVSGGTDSMCLLWAMNELSKIRNFSVAAIHFEHGIRGEESVADAEFVKNFCNKHGIDFYMESGDSIAYSRKHSCGLEEAARILRYEFFYSIIEKTGAQRIATAHNADDNIETVIMNLTRGSGLSGLSGIPPVRGPIIRPLLSTSRREIEEYMEAKGLPHIEDSTNTDTDYTRNRIRHMIVPILKDINPALAKTVGNTSALIRQDNEYLEGLASEFLKGQNDDSISIPELLALPYSIASRVLRQFSGLELSFIHTENIFELCSSDSPSGELTLPHGVVLHREYSLLKKGAKSSGTFAPIQLHPGESTTLPELSLRFSCENITNCGKIYNSLNTFFLKCDSICGTVTVRPRKTGDSICLPGRNCTKSLKKLFIEAKIPQQQRELIPVLSDENGKVLAVGGFGIDAHFCAGIGDNVLKIQIEEIN